MIGAIIKGAGAAAAIVGLAAGAGLGAWHALDGAPPVAAPEPARNSFDAARLLVIADADMAATAYADGRLFPIPEADTLTIVADPGADQPARVTAPTSNTVMGWPGAGAATPDGRFAFVIAGQAPAPRDVERVDSVYVDIPPSPIVTQVRLSDGIVIAERPACARPKSVDVAPSGRWILIACGDDAGELAVAAFENGALGDFRMFDLEAPILAERPRDAGVTYARVRPDGRAAAVVFANRAVALATFDGDGAAAPRGAAVGPVATTEAWLSTIRWAADGRHALFADVAWGPAPTDAVFNRDGAILSFRFDAVGAPRQIARAVVSKSPETFEINRAGDLLVAVNMERTYLPGGPLSLIPGREASSLSLVRFDAATGALTVLGPPIGFRGVLPEDAVFDRDGDAVAVVVYQDHDAPRSGGWVAFFDVVDDGPGPRLVATGRRLAMPRGAHDLVVID